MRVKFDAAFKVPEMVKPRLCVVVSKAIEARPGLCTVVPLSTSKPNPVMAYHCKVDPAFELPKPWGNQERWLKGDMIYAVGFHRVELLRLGKDENGRRMYQTARLEATEFRKIQACILHGLGMQHLTKLL